MTSNYFVGFIDALGFEDLVKNNYQSSNLEKIHRSLERVIFYLLEMLLFG